MNTVQRARRRHSRSGIKQRADTRHLTLCMLISRCGLRLVFLKGPVIGYATKVEGALIELRSRASWERSGLGHLLPLQLIHSHALLRKR